MTGRLEITGVTSDVWRVRDKADGKRKLAVCVTTTEGDTILLMSEHVAQHLSDMIWHGKL